MRELAASAVPVQGERCARCDCGQCQCTVTVCTSQFVGLFAFLEVPLDTRRVQRKIKRGVQDAR